MYCQLEFDGYSTVAWSSINENDARETAGKICNQNQADGVLYLHWSIDRTIYHRPTRERKTIGKSILDNFDKDAWAKLPNKDKKDCMYAYSDDYKQPFHVVYTLFLILLT